MRVLVVSQYYWPEPFNVTEACEELVALGHEVTVLTGLPNYPEGSIYEGYEHRAGGEETHNGVRIVRSRLVPRKSGPVYRFLNYESFGRIAARHIDSLGNDFDVVIAFCFSPLMSARPAIAYARRFGCPLLLYVIDLWPESLLAGGIERGSLVYRHYSRVCRAIYSAANRIAVTSPLFKGYIEDLLGHEVDSFELPQFAEDIFGRSDTELPEGYRPDRLNLTFAGNVGAAQSVQTVVRAAAELRDEGVLFHVVGSGSELEPCKELSGELGLSNVVFHGRHPLEEMPAFYNASDAMLATFANSPILGYTLPRKVQSYMAAGKPIIGTLVGESRRVVEAARCGLCCDAEDHSGLAELVRAFAIMGPSERSAMGERARAYNAEHFSRERFFNTLEAELKRLKEENGASRN